MKTNQMKKLVLASAVTAAIATLAACGSDSDNPAAAGGSTAGGNLQSNPTFTFDQTTFVGAVDPAAASVWWDFALADSVPTGAEAAAGADFDPDVNTIPGDYSAVVPATECPSNPDATSAIQDTGKTYTLGAATLKVCKLSGSILTDATLDNDVVWELSGQVAVGNGNRELTSNDDVVKDVTLTIEAGTVFRSGNGAFLNITRGAKIDAQGSATQPILFWGNADDDFNSRGEWGGLVIQGYGYNNNCGNPATNTHCNLAGEGAAGYFGGFDNSDNSGSLKYVIVAEAGNEVLVDNELNGISFQGVGYGTTIDYIQVHQNDDDGLEFFGGAVDAKHVVLTSNKDDDIDWDEGYVGNIQYGVIVKTTSKSNGRHAFELDTAGDANESAYQESNPTVANVTALALLSTAEEAAKGDGIHLKKGSEGQFFNMVFAGDFRNCVYMEDNTVLTSYDAAQDAFTHVYTSGCDTVVDAGTSGYTVTVANAAADMMSYDDFDAKLAESGDIPVVSALIEAAAK